MPSPEIKQLSEYRKRVESGLGQLKSQLLDLRDQGDEAGMKNVGKQIRLLQSEQAQSQKREYDQRLMRKQELMDELASYEGAGYKAYEFAGTPATGVGLGSMSVMPTKRVEYRIGKEGRKTLQSKLAELLDVDPNKINIDKGLSFDQMAAAEVMTTPEGKEGVLARFGDERVSDVIPVQIAGRENFLIKNPDDNYFLAYTDQNKGRQMLAKIQAGAFPVMSAMLGAGGAGKFIAQSGKTGLISQSVGGSGGITLANVIQEEAMGAIYDAPTPGWWERTKDLVSEAALGLMVDVPTAGLGRLFSTIKTTPIKNEVDRSLQSAIKTANKGNPQVIGKKAQEIIPPSGAAAGEAGLRFTRELAGAYPQSRYYRNVTEPILEQAENFQKALTGNPTAPQELREQIFDRVLQKQKKMTEVIAGRNTKMRNMLEGAFERRRNAMLPRKTPNIEAIGGDLQKLVAEAQSRGADIKDHAFAVFFKQRASDVRVKKSEIINIIQKATKGERNALKESASIDALIQRIEALPNEDVSLEFLRNSVQVARDSVTDNATKTAQQVAVGVSDALNAKFNQIVAQNNLSDAWQRALDVYDTNYQAFRRGSPGMMIGEQFGDFKKQPTKAINAILNDPKDVRDILKVLKNTGDERGEALMRKQLQEAYLEKIGLRATQGKSSKLLAEYKPEVVDELFGSAAPSIKRSLDEVNEAFRTSKVNLREIPESMADDLLKPLSINERRQIIQELVKYNKSLAKQEAWLNNEIFNKFIKKGRWDEVDSTSLAVALRTGTPSDVQTAWKNIPLKARKGVKEDIMASFFAEHTPKAGTSFQPKTGYNLWDGESVMDSLKGWERGKRGKPVWVSNMDTVMGKDMTDLVIANSRLSAATRPINKEEALRLRGLTSFDGIKVYGSGLVESARHRFLASALGSNRLEPYLRARLRRSADVERSFERMVRGVLGTRLGIQAAAKQSSNDPDYAAALNEVFADIARQETEE